MACNVDSSGKVVLPEFCGGDVERKWMVEWSPVGDL